MLTRRIFALCGVTVALTLIVAVTAFAAATKVSVRVEGQSSTLLAAVTVRTHSGSITKGRTPSGVCPSTSAAGALDVAVHGRWAGKYYASVPGIFITSILGHKPTGSDYWTVFINNRSSSLGICQLKLHRGDHVLFAVTDGSQYPLVLTAPKHAETDHRFQVKVSYDNAKGVAKPLSGVHVTGASGVTGPSGIVTITDSHPGRLTLTASRSGYIKSAPASVRVSG